MITMYDEYQEKSSGDIRRFSKYDFRFHGISVKFLGAGYYVPTNDEIPDDKSTVH